MHDDPQLNLAKVKQQISDWRINKISNSNKIPEEIKTAITNLIPLDFRITHKHKNLKKSP